MITILSFLFVLGVLVFVHEFGHFSVAKKVGVYVETFSLGFGPKLLKRKYGDTEYCISAFPLGGYVKLKGENLNEEPTGAADELMSQSIPARFSIFAAGPAMNVLLAILLISGVYFIGIQTPQYTEEPPVIRWVFEDSPAQESGLQVGDLIQTIGGTAVENWEQTEMLILSSSGKPLDIEVERGDETYTFTVFPEVDEQFGTGSIGIDHEWPPIVTGLSQGFPAEKAGIKVEDKVVAINGIPIVHWLQVTELLRNYPHNTTVSISLLRGTESIELSLTPKIEGERKLLGIISDRQLFEPTVLKKYGLFESFSRGIRKCWEMTRLTFELLQRLVTRQVSAKTIGGPIMIAQMSGHVARQGLSEFLFFMGFVSLSLGIFNLLPIPVLDGGHIFLLVVEFLNRKPLSAKKRELAQLIGLLILIPLMLFVFYNDIVRFFGW